jgi:hypothetical protein
MAVSFVFINDFSKIVFNKIITLEIESAAPTGGHGK